MPHSVHWQPEGVCVKFSGTIGSPEITATYEEISGDPRSDRIRYILHDFLGASRSTSVTLSDVKVFVALEMGASYGQTHPVWRAEVATDPSICDFLKYFRAVRTSPDPFQIFGTAEEARAWLNSNPLLRHKIPDAPSDSARSEDTSRRSREA